MYSDPEEQITPPLEEIPNPEEVSALFPPEDSASALFPAEEEPPGLENPFTDLFPQDILLFDRDKPERAEVLPDTEPLSHLRVNGVASPEPYILCAHRCDQGVYRARNEDSSFAFVAHAGGQTPLLPYALCLVADGMGGHYAGHEASRLISRQVAQHVMTHIYIPLVRGEASDEPIRDIMLKAIYNANRALYTPDPEKEGGTTLTAALVIGRRLYLTHVGDSRAYLFQDGQLIQLTTDHTVVQRLQDAGHITAEEAEHHPHRGLLYKALTGSELEVDTFTRSLPKQGMLFLCSDGLWGAVPPEKLQERLADPTLTLQEKADVLIHDAIQGGSTDNITAIIIQFSL